MNQNNGCCDVAITLMEDHNSIYEWSLRLYNELPNPPALNQPSNVTVYKCRFDFHGRVFRVQVIPNYNPWPNPDDKDVLRMKSCMSPGLMNTAYDELRDVPLDNTPTTVYENRSQCWAMAYCGQCWVLDALERLNELQVFANDDEFRIAHDNLNELAQRYGPDGTNVDMKELDYE